MRKLDQSFAAELRFQNDVRPISPTPPISAASSPPGRSHPSVHQRSAEDGSATSHPASIQCAWEHSSALFWKCGTPHCVTTKLCARTLVLVSRSEGCRLAGAECESRKRANCLDRTMVGCRAASSVQAFSLETGSSESSDLRGLLRKLTVETTAFVRSRTRSAEIVPLEAFWLSFEGS